MSIPNPFRPVCGKRETWPYDLLPDLLDAWLLREPSKTRGGIAVRTSTSTTTSANYYIAEPSTLSGELRTLLFVSTEELPPGSLYNAPTWQHPAFAGSVSWGCSFYDVPKAGLSIGIGSIVDTPARYGNTNVNFQRTPFSLVVKCEGNAWKLYSEETGSWYNLTQGVFSQAVPSFQWGYASAWAAYSTALSDAECVRRLEILKNYALK